jgi:hypothetical protein
MFIVARLLVLYGLIRLLSNTSKPLLCAGIYAGITLVLGAFQGLPVPALLLLTAVNGGVGALYFWLLDLTEDTFIYWVILVIGGLILSIF